VLKKVFAFAWGFVTAPSRTSDELANDPAVLWVGFWWSFFFLAAYSVTVLVFWLLGHRPVSRGWLLIPPERWYLVQTFTTIPVGLAGFLSYGGLAHLICRALGGKGSFEATFAVEVYCAIALGMRSVPWPAWVEILRTLVLPFIWIIALSAVALQRVHGTPPILGCAVTILALIPTGMVMAVFIR
jgi:hypothetical protein